jgi:hypothetical protein
MGLISRIRADRKRLVEQSAHKSELISMVLNERQEKGIFGKSVHGLSRGVER